MRTESGKLGDHTWQHVRDANATLTANTALAAAPDAQHHAETAGSHTVTATDITDGTKT